MTETKTPNQRSRHAWEENAQVWDAKMGDRGNDFFQVLCWPVLEEFLNPQPDHHILDIACGNGLTSRRLDAFGAQVTAFDFSTSLIEKARQRPHSGRVTFQVLDATQETDWLTLGENRYDSALSNMALFDMAEIEPLFRILPRLLKPGAPFVFSLVHPSFNNPSSLKVAEEYDDGIFRVVNYVKVSRYMTPFTAMGSALRNQPEPQPYFHRPLQAYLNLGFESGFVLDGFAERAFPPEIPATDLVGWGGQFSEIPAVVILRMRLRI